MFPSWISRVFVKTMKPSRRQRRAARPTIRPTFRPRLEALEDRTLPSATLPISLATSGTAMGNQPSYLGDTRFAQFPQESVSANGQYQVFESNANNLVNGITVNNGDYNVYLRNLSNGSTALVDVNSGGSAASNAGAFAPAISADGRYVVFVSASSDLTNNDANANGINQVYVRDMQTGQTLLVSLGIDGNPENAGPYVNSVPSIAEDGNGHLLVTYQDSATNLTKGDSSSHQQIFLTTLNLDSGGVIQYGSLKTTLVSSDNSGTGNGGNNDSSNPILSQDGSTLVFNSYAANLNVPGGYNDNNPGINNLYLYTPATQTLKLLSAESVTTTAATGNLDSSLGTETADTGFTYNYPHQALSANGQYLVFRSFADNLVPLPTITDVGGNIYRRDLVNGTTSLVSVSSDGARGVGPGAAAFSAEPVITPDGRYVAFIAGSAGDLTANSNGNEQVYVRDMQQGKTYLVSLYTDGNPAADNSDVIDPTIAETTSGQLDIAYRSNAALNQASTTLNYASNQVFVTTLNLDTSGNIQYNTLTTKLVSADSTGNGANGESDDPVLSKDGSTLAFESLASNLPGETLDKDANGNEQHQVFTFIIASGKLTQVSPAPSSGFYADSVDLTSISDNGQLLTYVYNTYPLPPNTTGGGSEVLAWNANTGTNTVVSSGSDSLFPGGFEDSASISGDGSTIVFGKGDTYGRQAIYTAKNWQSGSPTITQIASSASGLPETNTPQASTISISDNGQVIAYIQNMNYPVASGDQVSVYDAGTTNSISVSSNNSDSVPIVSADGSTVAFDSGNNLVFGITYYDTNNVFAYNVASKTVSLASAKAPGVFAADGNIDSVSLSNNGRYLAFASSSNDLLPGVSGYNAFGEDVQKGVPVLIASIFQGTLLSGDGSTVAFLSKSKLTSNDISGGLQLFTATNWQSGSPTLTLVSVDSAGTDAGNSYAENPSLSTNGQIVAFDSPATNLTSNDANAKGYTQIFVRNLGTNTTSLVSSNSAGSDGGDQNSNAAVVSTDGSTVIYNSSATDLVSGVSVPTDSSGNPIVPNVYAFLGSTSAPALTGQPSNQTVTADQSATFTSAASGLPVPVVQWQVSTDGGKTFTNIGGATSSTLTLSTVQISQNGSEYRAVFSNIYGTVTTNAATLTVQAAPAITSNNNTAFAVGQGGSFTVTATGSPTPVLSESGALPSGVIFTDNGNGTAILSGTPAAGTQGTYQISITAHNGVGSDFTQSFTLTLNLPPAPPASPSPPPPVSPQPPTLDVPPLLAFFNSLLGGVETVNANGTETITDRFFGIPLLVSTFDSSGNLVSVDLLGFNITFLFG